MSGHRIDHEALDRLRRAFLDGTAGERDYWRSESDLASYDATFAQRIGWKWDYILGELRQRGWRPDAGDLLDWGCGSGIAHRAFLDHFGTGTTRRLLLFDRSSRAVNYAARRARSKYPGLPVEPAPTNLLEHEGATALGDSTVLISHLLTELTTEQLGALADAVASARSVLWIEPGTHEASRGLIAVRERLRARLHIVAPCTHRSACGLLAPGNERHWCHHFASPPAGIFVDGDWARFANQAGIDLRSLPLSFLVLDRRPPAPLPAGAGRILGAPRVYKAHALLLGCDESGVRERRLEKRRHPGEFRAAKKGTFAPLQVWREAEGKLTELQSLNIGQNGIPPR